MTALLLSLLVGLIGNDLYACLPSFARRVVRRHAAKLPSPLRERMAEEWLAELESSPSHLRKVIFALGLFSGTADLVRAYGEHKSSGIHGSLNATLKDLSIEAKAILRDPHLGGVGVTGHAPIVTVKVSDHVAVRENVTGGHIASTAQLFAPSVSSFSARSIDKDG